MTHSHLGYEAAKAHHNELLANASQRRLARQARRLRRDGGTAYQNYTPQSPRPALTAAPTPPDPAPRLLATPPADAGVLFIIDPTVAVPTRVGWPGWWRRRRTADAESPQLPAPGIEHTAAELLVPALGQRRSASTTLERR